MKRFLVLLITLVLSLSLVLSGCGGCNDNGGQAPTGQVSQEPSSFNATSVVLVDNSQSEYKIVIPEKSTKMEDFAAQELQYFLYESTGCKLEIIKDTGLTADNTKKYLSVGNTTLLASQTDIVLDEKVMGETTPSVDTKGNSVYMAGVGGYGILNSVYKFLQYEIGYKAYAYDCVKYDYFSKVYLLDFNYHYSPNIEYMSLNERQFDDKSQDVSAARLNFFNHDNGGSTIFDGGLFVGGMWCHTIQAVVSEGQYPQFWNAAQYCMSNPEALEVFAYNLTMNYILNTSSPFIMIGGNDNESICGCPECTNTIAQYGGGGLMAIFINKVADYVENYFAENNIEKEICLVGLYYLAYDSIPAKANGDGTYSALNPIVIPDGEGKVTAGICYAPMLACFSHPFGDESCEKNEHYTEGFRRASALTDNLFLYIYGYRCQGQYYHSYFFNNLSAYKSNYEFFSDLGFKYVNEESNRFAIHQLGEMFTYVRSRFAWDKVNDVEPLVDEFMDAYYGIASEYMKEYYDFIIEHYQSIYVKTNNHHESIYSPSVTTTTYPHQVYLNFITLLENAMLAIEKSDIPDEDKAIYHERIKREWYVVKVLEYDMYKDSVESDYLAELEKIFVEANEKYPIWVSRSGN